MEVLSAPLVEFDSTLFGRGYRERSGLLRINKLSLVGRLWDHPPMEFGQRGQSFNCTAAEATVLGPAIFAIAVGRRPIFIATLPGCASFGWLLCRSSVKDHSGYSLSSLRASNQNTLQRHYPSH
jgi:hypothetical protein